MRRLHGDRRREEKMGHSMDRRTFIKGGAAAMAAAGLGACGQRSSSSGESSSGEAPSGGTINYAITNPTSIDPFDIEEFNGTAVASQLFDQLTVYDYDTEELKPSVAESWESSDDAATWTFHIKQGLKFHDGTDVTAKSSSTPGTASATPRPPLRRLWSRTTLPW